MDLSFHDPVQVEHQPAPPHTLAGAGLPHSPPQPTEMPLSSPPFPFSTTAPESSAPDRPPETNGVIETPPAPTTTTEQPTETQAAETPTTLDISAVPDELAVFDFQEPVEEPAVSQLEPQAMESEPATSPPPAESQESQDPATETTETTETTEQPTAPEADAAQPASPEQTADAPAEPAAPEPAPPPPPEEEPAYWADIQEDTSVPDEDEMKEIEAATSSCNASDYDACEKSCFKPLDDPEYQPTEKARVTWKIKGVRGTKEKPNRAVIMRSPAAYVGGYYWTIKFFPRGNSVSSLSAYIECSTTPPKPDEQIPDTEFKVVKGPADANLSSLAPEVDLKLPASANSSKSAQYPYPIPQDGQGEKNDGGWGDVSAPTGSSSSAAVTPSDPAAPKQTWRVSAEIGVVLYNPAEPRTSFLQFASHQFNVHNPDWGWTHFHGPWDQVHRRQRGQRQPLLRDDTLAFDAYIRIIDDPTKSLWWHSSDSEPVWDSLNLTGYRPMGDDTSNYSHEVAGLVSWLMIAPVREIIQNVDILEHLRSPNVKPRPLCNALQKFLWSLRTQAATPQLHVSTDGVTLTLKNLRETSRDVIGFWELFRRSLELELEGTDALEKLSKLFDSQSLPGTEANCLPRDYTSRIRLPADKAKSVQSGLTDYLGSTPGTWSLPPVLHVELARQAFHKSSHQWKMIFDRVRMDEELDVSNLVPEGQSGKYTLYGFVVHKGSRASGQYHSILRPGGPGTHWLAFEDASENRVVCMTRKEAVEAHEGLDSVQQGTDKATPDVAVVVMYIRSDLVSSYLPGKLEEWQLPKLREHYFQSSDSSLQIALDETGRDTIRVELFALPNPPTLRNSVFDAYDLMDLARASNDFCTFDLPPGTTFSELRKKFAELSSKESGREVDPESVRFWKVGARAPYSPPALHLDTIHDLAVRISAFELDVLRLWVHNLSEDDAEYFAQLDPIPPKPEVPVEQPDSTTSQPAEPPSESPASVENNDVVMSDDNSPVDDSPVPAPVESNPIPDAEASQETREPSADAPTEPIQEDTPMQDVPPQVEPSVVEGLSSADEAAIAAVIAGDLEEFDRGVEMEAEPTPAPTEPENNSVADMQTVVGQWEFSPVPAEDVPAVSDAGATQQAAETVPATESQASPEGEADQEMTDAQPSNQDETRPADEADDSESEMDEAEEEVVEPPRRPNLVGTGQQVYYFIQVFDEEKQELDLVGGFLAKKSDVIKQALRKALKWPEDREFLLWQRVDGASVIAISSSQVFEDVVQYTHEGDCFIVGKKLNGDDRLKLAEAGKFSTPHGLVLYHWDLARRHPINSFTGIKTVEATYGGQYYTGSFKCGQWHGIGTHISDSGGTYTGSFVLGLRQGNGLMEYASGDTYEGDWFEDQRHGQGTFVERKTGNKYVGGYRDGKRHGKGVSYWEVADEEMGLCQICYTEDQDALFYPCGHVCACVDCAKQVETCPMCRKKAVSVVKIYRS